ncbi:hypothetical protein KJZ63_03310 [Patescibacteria group bacterium]|nr:hypothetical protein [Patescibacteria group bacterium]
MENDAQIQPSLVAEKKAFSPLFLMGGVLLLVLGFVGGAVLTKSISGASLQKISQNDQVGQVSENKQAVASSFVSLNKSTFASYPLVKDGKLFFIPITSGIGAFSPSIEVSWGGGAYGLGSSDPIASPDNQKIALIESGTGNLLLVTADGKQQVRVSNQMNVSYISGWSPDSNKLIVYATAPTVKSLFVPEGPVPEESIPLIQKLSPSSLATGYYLVDLNSNNVEHLSYLDGSNFITWVDANNILLNLEYSGKKYVVLNLKTYEANAELVGKALDPYFGEQISFSSTGEMWALTLAPTELMNGESSESKIVLAAFPSVTGEVIGEGKFAQVQGPHISPNGKKVIFQGYDVVNGPNFVYYYDGSETTKLFEGLPRKWVNDDKFIYTVSSEVGATNPSFTQSVYVYDTTTNQSTLLFGD